MEVMEGDWSVFEHASSGLHVHLLVLNGHNYLFHLLLPLNSLTAGVDFSTTGLPTQMTIPAGQTTLQLNISVTDELVVERDERFQVSFTYSGGQRGVVVRTGFDEANITIKNDDGQFRLG